GASFINSGNFANIATGGIQTVMLAVPTAANNVPLLVLRLQFTGGHSNGVNDQDIIDNILIGGTIVPEPTTIGGGLLGVLGPCWRNSSRYSSWKVRVRWCSSCDSTYCSTASS